MVGPTSPSPPSCRAHRVRDDAAWVGVDSGCCGGEAGERDPCDLQNPACPGTGTHVRRQDPFNLKFEPRVFDHVDVVCAVAPRAATCPLLLAHGPKFWCGPARPPLVGVPVPVVWSAPFVLPSWRCCREPGHAQSVWGSCCASVDGALQPSADVVDCRYITRPGHP